MRYIPKEAIQVCEEQEIVQLEKFICIQVAKIFISNF